MYPNSALSAGQLAIIAVVAVVCLAIWITGVFVAAREPRRRDSSAGRHRCRSIRPTWTSLSAKPPDRRSGPGHMTVRRA